MSLQATVGDAERGCDDWVLGPFLAGEQDGEKRS